MEMRNVEKKTIEELLSSFQSAALRKNVVGLVRVPAWEIHLAGMSANYPKLL